MATWTAFAYLSEKIGQRLSGLWTMNTTTGKSRLYEALAELASNVKQGPRFTADLQATNGAVSGGADETYYVMLGNAGVASVPIKGIVRNKFEAAGGATFPVCLVTFGHVNAAGLDFVAVTAERQMAAFDAYSELTATVLTSVAATRIFAARVIVPAAVTVALGLDMDVQR